MPRFIALLRGINVGGNTMLKMSDLNAAMDAAGFGNVATYINSGNIGFDLDISASTSRGDIEQRLESLILSEFGKTVPVMVREQQDILRIIRVNPFAGHFESHKEMHVLFLKEPLPQQKIDELMSNAVPPERFAVMGTEVYCHLPLGVTESLLGKSFFEKKLKVAVTARNWRTVEKLSAL